MMKFDFYITGTIGLDYDWWSGTRGTTASQVKRFLEENKDKELNIAVSSPGGYLDDGITIGELIAAHGKCNMVIMGMTASAATVLCMKAKSVKIAKGSMMLIHNSSYTLDVWTTANKQDIDAIIANFKKYRDDLDTFDKAIAQFYSSRNHKTMEENMAMMDKEKWMLAEEAVDFGIVDAILDEESVVTNAKAVKNAYIGRSGIADHYGLPELPEAEKIEKPERRFADIIKGVINKLTGCVQDSEEEETKLPTSKNNLSKMKNLILNLVCGLLAVDKFVLDEKGVTTLNEEQLVKIENDLKSKADRITALENDKKAAEDAKKVAEDAKTVAETAKGKAEKDLADLQKAFDDYKKQAGDTSAEHPGGESGKGEDEVTAKSLLESIKNLM